MKRLAEQFETLGFTFKQLKREGRVALFERYKIAKPHYEVIVIQESPELELWGRITPAHERMPGAETWGTHGFTYLNLEEAEEKFNQLVEKEKQRKEKNATQ